MNYQIREMLPEDGKRVLEIFKQGIDGGNATFDKEVPSWETWDNKYFKVCRLILEDENGVVQGWAAIQPISARVCYKGVAEVSIYLKYQVSRKCSDFVMKIMKSEEGYRDNPTSFERFSAEIWTFYETSICFL